MMGKTRSFQEAMATPFEDKRLLKESMNKEQNKEGGIMKENKIRKRRMVVGLAEAVQIKLFEDKRLLKESMNKEQNKEGGIMKENKIRKRRMVLGLAEAVQIKQYDTLYLIDVLKGKQNEMEERQMEENKIKEAQKWMKEEGGNTRIFIGRSTFESMMYSPEEIRDELRLSNSEFEMTSDFEYMRFIKGFFWYADLFGNTKFKCSRDHLKLSTKPTLMDIERELTEFREEQLGQQLIFREEQLGQQLIFREEQLGQQLIFQGGQSRRKLFERRTKTMLHGILENCLKRGGNAVVEDDVIIEREKLTDVTEELSGEFDDEEKEKRELEQLLRCKVCLDSDACVVLFPCRHMATCEYCEGFLQCCPVCRSFIDEAVKVNEEN